MPRQERAADGNQVQLAFRELVGSARLPDGLAAQIAAEENADSGVQVSRTGR